MIFWKISMIKLILVFFFFVLFSFSALGVDKTPDSRYGTEYGIDFRALKKYRRYIFLAETKNRQELTDHAYNQVMLGSYYRITKRFRMGLFFQAEQGLRWDEDWAKGAVWRWQDMNSRWDYSTVVDTTYTDKINRNWLWEMKGRLYYYHSRDALQLRLRPGLRYFVIKEGKPIWQLFTEVEGYIPLNYGQKSLYEYWIYAGSLYQLTPKFALGPVLAWRERWFHAYDKFEDKSGQSFKANFESVYVGLNALYSF